MQQIVHLVSKSFGDIQKAHHNGIWQFGNQPNVKSLEIGAIIILKTAGIDEFYVVGFSSSTIHKASKTVDWPSVKDMGISNNYKLEFSIAPIKKELSPLTKSEIESSIGTELKMKQGCLYTIDKESGKSLMERC